MVIGRLRIERWSAGGEIGQDHIGDDGTRFGKVEAGQCRIHCYLFEILASSQEFCVDRADLVQYIPQLAKVAEPFGDLFASGVWYIFSVGTSARLTDHQISLRAMARTVATMAVRPTAPLVGFGQ
jgi:hypothetical protein